MITWNCRQCGDPLEVPESAAADPFECPKCGTHSRPPQPRSARMSASPATTPVRTQNNTGSGGLFSAILGNASEVDRGHAIKEVNHLLVPGERVELAFKLIRDLVVFTDRRLILIDKQGLTGKKVECHSVPYKSIVRFSIETAGTFDLDAEMKIYVSGTSQPLEKQFRKGGADIFAVQRAIATAVVGRECAHH